MCLNSGNVMERPLNIKILPSTQCVVNILKRKSSQRAMNAGCDSVGDNPPLRWWTMRFHLVFIVSDKNTIGVQ